jgi:hypothetical protein
MKRCAIIGLTLFAAIAVATAPAVASKLVVATYHYDNQRTGWNGNETTLTPANVGSTSFGVLAQVGLDDQVDAQPLVVPNQQITAGPTPGAYQSFTSRPKPIRSTPSEHPMAPCCLNEILELRFPRRSVAPIMVRMLESTVLRSSMWQRRHYMSSPIQ